MIVIDLTVVNIALPSIARSLDFSAPSLAWVLNAYSLTFGGLLLLGGRAGRHSRSAKDVRSRHRGVPPPPRSPEASPHRRRGCWSRAPSRVSAARSPRLRS